MQRLTRGIVLAVAVVLFGSASASHAINLVGYWRMETDNDAGAGFSIPSEAAGSALTGANASLQALNGAGVSFFPVIPSTGAANAFGLNGNADINGTVAHYSALDLTSGTFEFYARSNEGDARLLLRQTGTTGLRIDQPNALRVQYSTAAGQVTLTSTGNLDADWDHIAFTYDEVTGIGRLFLNGIQIAVNDGPDNQGLTWPAATSLLVGNGVDGGSPFSGNSDPFFDELRILDQVVTPIYFLNGTHNPLIPEPATASLALVGGLALMRRRQRA